MVKENIQKFEQVSKEYFESFITSHPNQLTISISGIPEPPVRFYDDFTTGKRWPESTVAKVKLYDGSEYHEGKQPEYFILNPLNP